MKSTLSCLGALAIIGGVLFFIPAVLLRHGPEIWGKKTTGIVLFSYLGLLFVVSLIAEWKPSKKIKHEGKEESQLINSLGCMALGLCHPAGWVFIYVVYTLATKQEPKLWWVFATVAVVATLTVLIHHRRDPNFYDRRLLSTLLLNPVTLFVLYATIVSFYRDFSGREPTPAFYLPIILWYLVTSFIIIAGLAKGPPRP